MAKHLDLEEQEQLDQLKAFWNQYGNLISWVLIVVFGGIALYNGWQYWQRKQANDAAVLFDSVEQAVKKADMPLVERSLADMQSKFAGTNMANQAAMLAAQQFYAKGDAAKAKSALQAVLDKPSDEGYAALSRLRLASLHLDAKAYADAAKVLEATPPPSFEALFADRKGDVLAAQDKRAEAVEQWKKAYKGLDDRLEYRRLVEIKLNAAGVDVAAVVPAAGAASAAAPAAAPAAPVSASAAAPAASK
jgi:predicted negative regulator of RcsB-dependent stress response